MNAKEIIQLLEQSGKKEIVFDDLFSRPNPHTAPNRIQKVAFEGITWFVYVNDAKYHLTDIVVSDETLASIYQRLKLMLK